MPCGTRAQCADAATSLATTQTRKAGGTIVIKIWGRKTSANVQKVMWAIGEIGLPHERIDIGGPFGQNREPGRSSGPL